MVAPNPTEWVIAKLPVAKLNSGPTLNLNFCASCAIASPEINKARNGSKTFFFHFFFFLQIYMCNTVLPRMIGII